MSQYVVTHTCGHEQTHKLYGPYRERERKVEWLSTTECTECYREAKRAAGPSLYARVVGAGTPTAGVEIYAINSYEQRDTFKARGYRFGDFSAPNKSGPFTALGLDTVRGWGIILRDSEPLMAELRWIAEQGWQITKLGLLDGLLQSVIEGRIDLIPGEGK